MTTDQQLIERIQGSMRAEVASLEPASDLLETLQSELRREQRWTGGGRVPRTPGVGGVVAVLGAAVVVAVVVLAVVLVGHRRPSTTAGVPAAARQLVARLAVLRRPQTAADRGLGRHYRPSLVVSSLTRLASSVQVEHEKVDVYVMVESPTPREPRGVVVGGYAPLPGMTHPFSAKLGDQVLVAAQPVSGGLLETGDGEPGAALDQPGNVLTSDGQAGVNASVVPDGVTRVKWVFTGLDVRHPKPITVYPKVTSNVAVSATGPGEGVLASAVWYDASGRVIASYTGSKLARGEQAPQQLFVPTKSDVSPLLYNNFAVFRRAIHAQPPLPGRIASFLSGGPNASNGVDIARTRYVRLNSRIQVWLVPGSHGVCLVQRGPRLPRLGGEMVSSGCNNVNDLLTRAPFATGPGPGNTRAYIAVVPDDKTVILTTKTGATITARVIDNVAYATSPTGFRLVRYRAISP